MRHAFSALAIAAVAFGLAGHAAAQSTAPPVAQADRIEEDWALVTDDKASPDGLQVNTVMCPAGDLSQPAFVLNINYRLNPAYSSGGLQVLVYNQTGLASSKTLATNPLNLANETVRWTQRMTISNGTVQYVRPSVDSMTWGTFTDTLVLGSFVSTLTTFTAYSPDASASNSGGAWKTTGLKSLTLVRVRYYAGNTLLTTDSVARPVDCTRPFTKP